MNDTLILWQNKKKRVHTSFRKCQSNVLLKYANFNCNFLALLFNFLNYFIWRMITDAHRVPDMYILFIKYDLKWCLHLTRSIFLYQNWRCMWLIDINIRGYIYTQYFWDDGSHSN